MSENGERYAGYFLSGLREGYGSQIYANLDNYEGRWERDVWNGWGRHISPQRSEVYEGSFVNGQRHGNGHLQANGRTIYKGEWTHGKRHGKEKVIFMMVQSTRERTVMVKCTEVEPSL